MKPALLRVVVCCLGITVIAGCGVFGGRRDVKRPEVQGKPAAAAKGGGYYRDDGPGDRPPAHLDAIPDAVPRIEPLHRGATRPYTVMGRQYVPMTVLAPYRARGIASWYGRRYHGKKTSMGETYDMYGMTAAHPTLPLPSYVRVTHLGSGKSVVLRVNDRGPFIDSRLIDLSYTAAHKLGVLAGGSAMVEVEALLPGSPVTSPADVVSPPAAINPPQVAVASSPAEQHIAVSTDATGMLLQLGAFASKENAEAYAARLRMDLPRFALQVQARDGFFRVLAGPFQTQGEAREAADQVAQVLGVKPLILGK